MSNEIVTFCFKDVISSDDATIIIRNEDGHIGLCLSLREGSDTEVFFNKENAKKLIEAISKAL